MLTLCIIGNATNVEEHEMAETLIEAAEPLDPVYAAEREKRPVYSNEDLHLLVLQLILSLLLNPHKNSVEKRYYPTEAEAGQKLNVPFVLQCHVNHPGNSKLVRSATCAS